MNCFLALPDSEKSAVFRAVGESMGIPAGYVEKDFWVCWMLDVLFSSPELSPHLVFRGGTSLSKAYQAIHRFSEDIDLSISRDWLGVTPETDPALAENASQSQARQKQLRQLTRDKLTRAVIPVIEAALANAPFDSSTATIVAEGESEPFDKSRDPYCIYFTYPSLAGAMPAGYISARVKLEFSARAEGIPEETRSVQSFAAQHYPAAFSSLVITTTSIARSGKRLSSSTKPTPHRWRKSRNPGSLVITTTSINSSKPDSQTVTPPSSSPSANTVSTTSARHGWTTKRCSRTNSPSPRPLT
jgi:Nucleotidyl transferase AbiEii toxin, Type IV TA system